MRIILVGPPGCGKGTQAKLLSKRMKVEHIGTGDLLREAIRNETSVGLRAKPYVEVGNLVPDELVNDLVSERFQREDRPKSFILDGYPRTLMQAKSLDKVLASHGLPLTEVILLDVCDTEIVKRVTGRWSCPKLGCKATFHTLSNPSKVPGVCDDCQTVLVQREDDHVETVKSRLTVYHKDTVPLLPYYEQYGLLKKVHGTGDIEQIYKSMVNELSI
ncbi:MAG: adenylate kinase [Planctomycetes bacterium]|nr:adenylate kinase [Planctomycetota bacterium]NBY02000.1 adenylate kinase [Planctomycetota bacterium]